VPVLHASFDHRGVPFVGSNLEWGEG